MKQTERSKEKVCARQAGCSVQSSLVVITAKALAQRIARDLVAADTTTSKSHLSDGPLLFRFCVGNHQSGVEEHRRL